MLITLINLGCLFTTWRIALKLFPQQPLTAQLAVIILATGVFWFHFFNRIRFDGLLTLFTVLYINYTITSYRQHKMTWTVAAGICMGLGFLAKGAAILIFVLPFYLLLPRYELQQYPYRKWLAKMLLTLIIALIIVATWAIPLYLSLGPKTMSTMFISQQHSRVLLTHHLGELPNLFISFLPWTVMPMLLLNLRHLKKAPRSPCGLLGWTTLLSGLFFTFFVLMHVKRYLLPLYPLVAIMLAYTINLRIDKTLLTIQNRILILLSIIISIGLITLSLLPSSLLRFIPPSDEYALWGIALLVMSVVCWKLNGKQQLQPLTLLTLIITALLVTGIVGINGIFTRSNDIFLQQLALQMRQNQQRHIPQANLISGGYQAFDFKGELQQPLPLFNEHSVAFKNWLHSHPNGILYFSMRKHIRPCMKKNAYQLKGSDRIIAVVNVHHYTHYCQ